MRVERLNDIDDVDAIAEGIQRYGDYWRINAESHPHLHPVDAFCDLWESINGPGSWEANPWVWVVGFRVIKP